MAHGAGHHQSINALPPSRFTNASRPHNTTVCPARPCQPRRARKPWRARALALIYRRGRARGGRPFATAKAAYGRSGQGRELEAATISARRRPIVRGGGQMPKSTSLFSRPTRVRITAPALRAGRHEGNEAAADLPDLAGESPVDAVVMCTSKAGKYIVQKSM